MMKKVLTTGCFDLFHMGHVDYLTQIAKAYPDYRRVVAIVTDS